MKNSVFYILTVKGFSRCETIVFVFPFISSLHVLLDLLVLVLVSSKWWWPVLAAWTAGFLAAAAAEAWPPLLSLLLIRPG